MFKAFDLHVERGISLPKLPKIPIDKKINFMIFFHFKNNMVTIVKKIKK